MVMKVLMIAAGLMLQVGEVVGACRDVTLEDAVPNDASKSEMENKIAKCARNVVWARKTGISTRIDYYTKFDNLTASSSFGDFQCALHKLTIDANVNSTGHECMSPCSKQPLTYKNGTEVLCGGETVADGNTSTDSAKKPAEAAKGWPTWAWVLLVLGLLCCVLPCLGVLCSCFLCYEAVAWIFESLGLVGKKPQKKKRAVKKTAETGALAATPTPVATTAVPMPVYTSYAAPVTTAVTTAPPVYLQAQPAPMASVSYAAPAVYAAPAASVSYAAPMTYEAAAPMASVSYAAPMQFAAQTHFDMLDANHDGQISRQEMAAALR
jgi:hypothetical protein